MTDKFPNLVPDPLCDDPFAPEANPDRHYLIRSDEMTAPANVECHCDSQAEDRLMMSRRHLIAAAGAAVLLPAQALADKRDIPCVQDSQKVKPCRHRYCRNYGGSDDYYERE